MAIKGHTHFIFHLSSSAFFRRKLELGLGHETSLARQPNGMVRGDGDNQIVQVLWVFLTVFLEPKAEGSKQQGESSKQQAESTELTFSCSSVRIRHSLFNIQHSTG